MAQKTIENMHEAGAERVFRGEEHAVKIPYGIKNILEFSDKIVTYENGKNANGWLDEYKKDPRVFSFKPGEYEKWACNWLK